MTVYHDCIHPKLGKIKLYGVVENGSAKLWQIYKQGVPMLFFERGDRNMPTTFTRTEIQDYEAELLSSGKAKRRAKRRVTNSLSKAF